MQERKQMTARERSIYEYVVLYRKEKRFSPSMRQIAAGVGLRSVSTVQHYIHSLSDKGWILPYDGAFGSIIPYFEKAL